MCDSESEDQHVMDAQKLKMNSDAGVQSGKLRKRRIERRYGDSKKHRGGGELLLREPCANARRLIPKLKLDANRVKRRPSVEQKRSDKESELLRRRPPERAGRMRKLASVCTTSRISPNSFDSQVCPTSGVELTRELASVDAVSEDAM